MTEITQVDRDMAAHIWTALDADQLDTASLQIFFARHRMEGRAEAIAEVVAWLRKTANMNPQSPEAKSFVLLLCNAIEAGEHMK